MATSGNSLNPITRDQIIIKSLKKCGQGAEGESLSAEQITDAADDLNRIIKGFQADGVKLWAYQELVLFLDPASKSYALGPNGARCVAVENIVATSSTDTAFIGATSITVASAAGIVSGMNIGILCDDNSLFWTTVAAPPAGNTVTLAVGLPVQASSSPNVWAYETTAGADRPLRIEQARVQISQNNELTLRELSRSDYFAMPNKIDAGTPNSFYYNPSLNTGTLYVWPLPEDSSFYLNMTAYRPLQIFVNPTDNLDAPDETQQALIWALADEIKTEYGVDAQTSQMIAAKAQYWLAKVQSFDVEEASVIFMPDFQ